MFNNAGILTNTNGDQVLGADGGPIQIDPTTRYEVSDDGIIQQAGANLSLMVVRPNNAGDLTRVGDNLFKSLSEFNPLLPIKERS